MADYQGACPNCGNTTLSFYFGPDERTLVMDWREDGSPSRVAIMIDQDHYKEEDFTSEDVEAAKRAMGQESDDSAVQGHGYVLNCSNCAHWFNPEETAEAEE